MSDKTNTGLTMDSDVLQGLDNEILQLKADEVIPDKRIRSRVITEIVRDWLTDEQDKKAWAERHGLPSVQEDGTGNRVVITAD